MGTRPQHHGDQARQPGGEAAGRRGSQEALDSQRQIGCEEPFEGNTDLREQRCEERLTGVNASPPGGHRQVRDSMADLSGLTYHG